MKRACIAALIFTVGCGASARSEWPARCAIHSQHECRVPLAPCAASLSTSTSTSNAPELIAIEGVVSAHQHQCTVMDCGPYVCCNDCTAVLTVSDAAGRHLLLSGTMQGRPLACYGDDSATCCTLPTDGMVLRLVGRVVPPTALSDQVLAEGVFEPQSACSLGRLPAVHDGS